MLGIVLAVLGWLIRTVFASLRSELRKNTAATDKLTDAMQDLGERVARLEGPRRRG